MSMSNGKVLALSLLGGLALIGVVVISVLWRGGSTPQGAADSLGHRLLAHFRDRKDYRLFIGMPPAAPAIWVEVDGFTSNSVTLRDSKVVDLSEVTAYFVAYPSGALVDYRCPNQLPVPGWVQFPEKAAVSDQDLLKEADLKDGRSLVRIDFGKSTSEANSRDHYSTKLTNTSGRRVRVLRFGGYTKAGNGFSLNTITSRFFTAEDFKEWYGQKGEWIEPGESLTDPNNSGSPPVLWAYFCEAEGGRRFLAGGVIESGDVRFGIVRDVPKPSDEPISAPTQVPQVSLVSLPSAPTTPTGSGARG